MGSEQYKVAQKQGIKHGIKTGIKYGTTRAAGMGLLNKLGTRIGSKFIPGVGQAWLVGDIGYYGTKWMTKKYAELHAASGYGRSGDEAGKIISKKVKVKDIYWDQNDVNEFGYFPEAN